jgi:hypothetical protein
VFFKHEDEAAGPAEALTFQELAAQWIKDLPAKANAVKR